MKHAQLALLTFVTICGLTMYVQGHEIDYDGCRSIQEAIERETQEIVNTDPNNHCMLAELYALRGESYLLNAQYDFAIEDFKNSNARLGHALNGDEDMIVAFRIAFGEVISYDNLGMVEQASEALEQLKIIAAHIGCDDCIEHNPCIEQRELAYTHLHHHDMRVLSGYTPHFQSLVSMCKDKSKNKTTVEESKKSQVSSGDNYSDVIGPDEAPYSSWCEEAVTATGNVMIGIACLAPNNGVRIALTSVINALTVRGVKCCQAGGFWKACVAPVCRKMREWNLFKKQNIRPDSQNLHLFIN